MSVWHFSIHNSEAQAHAASALSKIRLGTASISLRMAKKVRASQVSNPYLRLGMDSSIEYLRIDKKD